MYLPIVEESNKRVWSPERSYMFFAPFFWKHRFGVRRLNKYVSSLIVKRWNLRRDEKRSSKTSTRHHDVLDKVLAHYENENPTVDVIPVNDIEQIRDEFKTFMLAGHETSAAMMMWALFELMKNDSLMEKVRLDSS
jgi:cytochrome P450